MGPLLFYFTGLLLLKEFEGIQSEASCPSHIAGMKNAHTALFRDTCYLFVDTEVFWKTARQSCWDLGGEMLTIRDMETNNFIRKILDSKELDWRREGVWLGARYQYRRWRWTDGTSMKFKNWASGQPSRVLRFLSVEDCAQMRREDNWKWHDHICGSLNFHYNYICQFSTDTTPTPTRAVKDKTYSSPSTSSSSSHRGRKVVKSSHTKDSKVPSQKDSDPNTMSDQPHSDLYRHLGQDVYRLLQEKGLSSDTLAKLLENSAMGDNSNGGKSNDKGDDSMGSDSDEKDEEEQVTSRVASSASNREEDNGNMTIVIVVVSLTVGFLLILLLIFLIMRRHNQIVKAKAEQRAAVRYTNPQTNLGWRPAPALTNQMSHVSSHSEARPPPPIPASRPPPMNDTYLQPSEMNNMYSEVIHTNLDGVRCDCPQQSHQGSPASSLLGSDSDLGACGGGSDPDADMRRPLMASQVEAFDSIVAKNNSKAVSANGVPSDSSYSCSINPSQSEYIAMSSLATQDSCEKLNPNSNSEKQLNGEKHTYTNVHLAAREGGAVENQYETLPCGH